MPDVSGFPSFGPGGQTERGTLPPFRFPTPPPYAFAALTSTVNGAHGVRGVEGMPVLTVRLSRVGRGGCSRRSQRVRVRGHDLHVIGIDAQADLAQMVDLAPVSNRTPELLVRETVRKPVPAVDPQEAVPLVVGARPQPAPGRLYLDEVPEPF
jgi:hypothetical protein